MDLLCLAYVKTGPSEKAFFAGTGCLRKVELVEGNRVENGPSENCPKLKSTEVGLLCRPAAGCLRKVGSVEPVGCEGLPSQPTEMTHWVQGQQRVSSSGRGILDSVSGHKRLLQKQEFCLFWNQSGICP